MPSLTGEISITIGKLTVQDQADKARPCYLRGTEVIVGSDPILSLRSGNGMPAFRLNLAGRARRGRALPEPIPGGDFHEALTRAGVLCFAGLARRGDYDRRKRAFRRQFLEGGQVAALQVIPLAEQFAAL